MQSRTTMSTLEDERGNARFDVESMKLVFWGGRHLMNLCQRMAYIAASDPAFEKNGRVNFSREDQVKSGLRKAGHMWRLVQKYNLSDQEAFMLRLYVDERTYSDLHWNMFVPSLEGQATAEQQAYWLPLARSLQIIGCYAQTELGHGSNVRGIETTATFDASTDEFILNSPTITSTKWWPGGLGKVATHALIQARLLIDQKDYGVHAFIVQVRNMEDHNPLQGITVGDIGMKYGNNSIDNGFIRFSDVRIPRTHMLMRMANVTKEGNYSRTGVPFQILYGAMITAREIITSEAAINLSRAVTIAVRYSAVRRQFGGREGFPETQILDYSTQQQRLFPLLASSYAFQLAAHWLKWLYNEVQKQSKESDFTNLQEVHACTAGLKALTTSVTAEGIEECRKLCGGHGYLCSSGLPELYTAYLPAVTYEGENTILFREVGKFLLNAYIKFQNGATLKGTVEYISKLDTLCKHNCIASKGQDFLNEQALLTAFEARSLHLICMSARKVEGQLNFETGLEEFAVDIVAMAKAHCELVVVSKFYDKLQENIPGTGVKEQLRRLYFVYAMSLMHNHLGEFMLTGYLSAKQALIINVQFRNLLLEIRRDAVALVDAFNHTDHFLGSCLGCYDGDVYHHLYNEAWKSPLNHSADVDACVSDYVLPTIKANWRQTPSKL